MPASARVVIPTESERIQVLKDVIEFQNEQILRLTQEKERLCERLMITNEAIARAMKAAAQRII